MSSRTRERLLFHRPYPRLIYDYETGDPVPPSVLTRGSAARLVDAQGTVISLPAGQPRDIAHYGSKRETLLEGARTNLCATDSARDLTDADWTPTDCTPLKDQTGVDGAANGASSLEATDANATILQAITSASAARITSAYVKRITGTGDVEMTQDNGSTWTAIVLTSAWTRFNLAAVTSTNPTIGFRIVTSGDKIAVDFVQHELGSWISSPLDAQETRAADIFQADLPASFTPGSGWTCYGKIRNGMLANVGWATRVLELGVVLGAGSAFALTVSAGTNEWRLVHRTTVGGLLDSTISTAPTIGDEFEFFVSSPSGVSPTITWGVSKNGGTVATNTHTPGTWDADWNDQIISLMCSGTGTNQGNGGVRAAKIIPWLFNGTGDQIMAQLRGYVRRGGM